MGGTLLIEERKKSLMNAVKHILEYENHSYNELIEKKSLLNAVKHTLKQEAHSDL